MKIDRAGVGFPEQVIFDLRRPKLGIHVRLVFAEKTTILRFDSYDSIHSNQITRRISVWLNQKHFPHLNPLPKMGRSEPHDSAERGRPARCVTRLARHASRFFGEGPKKKRAG